MSGVLAMANQVKRVMFPLTSAVVYRRWSEEHRVAGYLDTFTHWYQEWRREWRLFGSVVWSTPLFREEIPSWVIIGLSTVGCYDDGNWQSAAPRWLHDVVKNSGTA